jgi:hypothetical protein
MVSSNSLLSPVRCGPGLGQLVDPSVEDQPDRHRVQEVQLLATAALGGHQSRFLEYPEVFHDAKSGHGRPPHERAEGLPVVLEELVEQAPAGWIGKRSEGRVHARHYM